MVNLSGFYWSKRWWGGSGISWTICKSFAPHSRQITIPVPQHSVFRGQMPFLPPNQQCQSTEGILSQEISKLISACHGYNRPEWQFLKLGMYLLCDGHDCFQCSNQATVCITEMVVKQCAHPCQWLFLSFPMITWYLQPWQMIGSLWLHTHT